MAQLLLEAAVEVAAEESWLDAEEVAEEAVAVDAAEAAVEAVVVDADADSH